MRDFFLPDLRSRNTKDREKMDFPDADPELLLRTVHQFRLINTLFSASRRLLRRHVFALMEQDPARTYSLLDVGAGGCDIARWAVREARRRRLKLSVTALDNDPRILPFARKAVRDYPEIRVMEGDALDLVQLDVFDFIFSNHFLHHLSWDEIALLLPRLLARTRLALVMNDLQRSRWAFLGATLAIGLLARRSFAFYDGRLSIRRGFLPEEFRKFLQARLPGAPIQVLEAAPARIVLLARGTLADGTNPVAPLRDLA